MMYPHTDVSLSNSTADLQKERFCLTFIPFYACQSRHECFESPKINNDCNKAVFAFSTHRETAAAALEHVRGWHDLVSAFMSWKSHSSAREWRRCQPGSRHGCCSTISAALEDTAVVLLVGWNPSNQRDFKTTRRRLNSTREHMSPSTSLLSEWR